MKHQKLHSVRDYERLPQSLPHIVRALDLYERHYSDRETDDKKLVKDTWNVEPHYLPESRYLVTLDGYWVNEEALMIFSLPRMPASISNEFLRVHQGQRQALLLIHPASERYYRTFLGPVLSSSQRERFLGSPTSSSRTLIVWREDSDDKAWLVKVSLARIIGELKRTISGTVLSKCIGTTMILDGSNSNMPESFAYFPEVLGILPRRVPHGGMLVRSFPSPRPQQSSYVPFFSLFATRDQEQPLLVKMSQALGISIRSLIHSGLLQPFANSWVDLAVDHGILIDAHAQNLLLEVDMNMRPTGRIAYRDFEDVYVDVVYRARAGLFLPEDLPLVCGLRKNYQLSQHKRWLRSAVEDSFFGGVIFTLAKRLNQWQNLGLCDTNYVHPKELESECRLLIEQRLTQKSGSRASYRHLVRRVYEERERHTKYKTLKESVAYRELGYLQAAFGRTKPDHSENGQ